MFLLLAALSCPETIVENRSKHAWGDSEDLRILKYSKKRCAELYPDAPCSKKVIKIDFQTYHVLCGEKE